MKQFWHTAQMKIDGLSARERMLVFAAMVSLLIAVLQIGVLAPLHVKQANLAQQILDQRNKIASIDAETLKKLRAFATNPDLAARNRLHELTQQPQQLSAELRTMESTLVAPEKVVPLLESILKANGRLQLLSLKSLPRAPMPASAAANVAATATATATTAAVAPAVTAVPVGAAAPLVGGAAASAAAIIYQHAVEIVVLGPYPDLLAYLTALDKLPVKLYWGNADLVATYPDSRLTFTVYTLSLDQTWIKL
jgi:MSHA biogenesis protein MshJ